MRKPQVAAEKSHQNGSIDYYPFGMEMPGRGFNSEGGYRWGFNGKENDLETGFQDYGLRQYNPKIIRFFNGDPLTKKYPELTPFQFASNTPIQAIDLDGAEAFFIHGTWSNSNTFLKVTKTTISEIFDNSEGKAFNWSGDNSHASRERAARDLVKHILKHRDENQSLTIVGHSHGGNVAIMAINILKNEYNIDVANIVTINTPVREYQLNKDLTTKHFNIYHAGDPVQAMGGNSEVIPDRLLPLPGGKFIPIYLGGKALPAGEIGPAGRKFENALNIEVEGFNGTFPNNLSKFHDTHKKPYLWSNSLKNGINYKFDSSKEQLDFQINPAQQDKTKTIQYNPH